MGRRNGRDAHRGLKRLWALFGIGILLLLVLIYCARFVPRPGGRDEVRIIVDEILKERADCEEALKNARAALPADAGIAGDWDFASVLRDGEDDVGFMILMDGYIEHPEGMPQETVDRAREAEKGGEVRCGFGRLECRIGLEGRSAADIRADLGAYLLGLTVIDEAKIAFDHGLCRGTFLYFLTPRTSGLTSLALKTAGHAVAQLEAGDRDRAFDTCLAGYDFMSLHEEWPISQALNEQFFGDGTISRALWRVVDAGPLTPEQESRMLSALDRRNSLEPLKKTLLFYGAYCEAGIEGRRRGYPEFAEVGFGATGRGALDRADQFIAVVDKPLFQCADELKALGEHSLGNYWTNRFVDESLNAVKFHSRGRLRGDAARIALALKAHKAYHGAYPATLAELDPLPVPDVPVDSLSGQPFEYRAEGAGFVLSVPAAQEIWPERLWFARN